MKFDVEMETRIIAAVSRRLMQRHHVWEGHLPEIIKLYEDLLQQRREVAELIAAQRRDTRMRGFRSDKHLVSVAREVRNESNCCFVFANDATTIFLLSTNHILKKYATRFRKMI